MRLQERTMTNRLITPIRVLLIGRHSIVLFGLEKLIVSQQPKMEVIGKFTHCAEVLPQVKELSPDVILLDLDLDIEDGIDAIPQLTAASKAKILIFTGLRDLAVHDRAMLAGASGVVGKEETVETVLRIIEKVHADQFWLDRAGTSRLVPGFSHREPAEKRKPEQEETGTLTPREREIVEIMTVHSGTTSKTIAAKLRISESTLRNHLSSIYGKLGVTSRLGLWDHVNKSTGMQAGAAWR